MALEKAPFSQPEPEKMTLPPVEQDTPPIKGASRREFLRVASLGLAGIALEANEAEAARRRKKLAPPRERALPHTGERAPDRLTRELFEHQEIKPPAGKWFRESAEKWRKRYAGEDPAYDRALASYLRRNGREVKTIHQELREGWNRLATSGDLATVRNITDEERVPFDVVFLALSESHWKKTAKSRVGAGGPWQFMPATAREYRLNVGRWGDDRTNVERSTRAACKYLKWLHKKASSQGVKISENDGWIWAFWSYNRGPGHVMRDLKRTNGDPNKYGLVCRNQESRNYAPKIFGLAKALGAIAYGKPKAPHVAEARVSPADRMYEEYDPGRWEDAERVALLETVLATYEKEAAEGVHTAEYVEAASAVVKNELEEARQKLKPQPRVVEEKLQVAEEEKGEVSVRNTEKKRLLDSVAENNEVPTVVYHVQPQDNLTKIATWLSPSPKNIATVTSLIRALNPEVKRWSLLRRGQDLVVPGTMIQVPRERLAVMLSRYYPSLPPDIAENYLKWLNGKDPRRERIASGEMILVPVNAEDLE